MVTASFADHVVKVLTPLLGPHTAKRALAMICKRANKEAPELGQADLAIACATLRPMLRTLIGNDVTVRVLADIGDHGDHRGDPEDLGSSRNNAGRGTLEGPK